MVTSLLRYRSIKPMASSCNMCRRFLLDYEAAAEEFRRAVSNVVATVGSEDYSLAEKEAEILHRKCERSSDRLREHYRITCRPSTLSRPEPSQAWSRRSGHRIT